jgi:hypothetical protein
MAIKVKKWPSGLLMFVKNTLFSLVDINKEFTVDVCAKLWVLPHYYLSHQHMKNILSGLYY